nr:zinc knuckle CX2CX4HX4C [Tanacetum cinerariifolium]
MDDLKKLKSLNENDNKPNHRVYVVDGKPLKSILKKPKQHGMNIKASTTKVDAMNTKNMEFSPSRISITPEVSVHEFDITLSSNYDESTMVAAIEDANAHQDQNFEKHGIPCNMGNKSYADLFNYGKKDATAKQEVNKPITHDLKSFSSILSHNSTADVGESDDNDMKLNVSKTNVPKKLNFRSLVNDDKVDNSNIVLPRAAIDKVKLHEVPLVAYSEDGISLIATQIGKHLMLDAYTSSMCGEAWGRINFARALIEVSSYSDLKKDVTMAVPNEDETDYTREVISVEYEWQPLRCVDCKKFGHSSDRCPKIIREPVTPISIDTNSNAFKEVQRKKINNKKADL